MEKMIEVLEKSYRDKIETDSLHQHLIKELERKNSEIERLSNEMEKQTNDMNKEMKKSIHMEEQIDYRLRILDELDQKLNELALEINRERV